METDGWNLVDHGEVVDETDLGLCVYRRRRRIEWREDSIEGIMEIQATMYTTDSTNQINDTQNSAKLNIHDYILFILKHNTTASGSPQTFKHYLDEILTSRSLYQWLHISNDSFPLGSPALFSKCYPRLFCFGLCILSNQCALSASNQFPFFAGALFFVWKVTSCPLTIAALLLLSWLPSFPFSCQVSKNRITYENGYTFAWTRKGWQDPVKWPLYIFFHFIHFIYFF